ncbi:glycoside hydrolase family 15 protein [Thermostichus vulcanus]|uniref:Glycoside hydrolase family 15 protein n=1 Tax=Thermostichus vulcanus str. 'Rupite' TaxID=2813851 RepID=A0ABT0C6M7_THEVL|nr:glycoside hydrolase family 15 protein [Thermostichus vulcanus]MCJ2541430.1 glycoside hydrolase family 15 protein [Thermostichus vulcanus str. 'Rupite']
MSYQPIENYGIIGNMQSVALVGMNGSIDWLCLPRFDSPSIFGALLDDEKGGRFQITAVGERVKSQQFYWPDTNVLVTRFFAETGIGDVVDYMTVGLRPDEPGYHWLIRRVRAVRGSMTFKLICRPAFNYGRDPHDTKLIGCGANFISKDLALELTAHVPLEIDGDGVVSEFTLQEEQTTFVVLQQDRDLSTCDIVEQQRADELFLHTVQFWRHWVSQCTYTGRWREMVHRSALALKLLTYEPTGGIIAAATTSLPEGIGGERNWDYRYTWIRDAAFTIYALMRIGFTEEAARFMHWIEERTHDANPDGSLQLVYAIDGRKDLTEITLDHLEGYKGSRPVRIGNGAYNQLQLDIYGELMDSVYLFNKYGIPISYDFWTQLRRLVDWVCDNWNQPDEGVWEVRGGPQHFVYSRLMCWVALDRALRLANKRSFPADRLRWERIRDQIYEEIMDKGWNEQLQTFVQAYGSEALDASTLIMPLVLFLAPTDPRMIKTLEAISRPLRQGGLMMGGLVHRYDVHKTDDGLKGEEGTFNICSFWMVEAMTRAGAADPIWLERARLMFEEMLGYSNHLGLYAEQIGSSGEALGNFPQAFTHLALISAAFNLDRALGQRD